MKLTDAATIANDMKPKRKRGVRVQRLVRPLYPSRSYAEFCAEKKQWLDRRCWKDFQKMWKEECKFRKAFEKALNERV